MLKNFQQSDLFWITPIIFCTLALLPMDYGFYILVRLAVFICAIYFIIKLNNFNNNIMWIFIALALLYNPLLPIYLKSKGLWMIVNLITIYIFYKNRKLVHV